MTDYLSPSFEETSMSAALFEVVSETDGPGLSEISKVIGELWTWITIDIEMPARQSTAPDIFDERWRRK